MRLLRQHRGTQLHRLRRLRPAFEHYRHDPVTQEITIEVQLVVGRILDPLQLPGRGGLLQIGPGDRQKRPVNITILPALHRRHGRQPAGTGTTQQSQHQGLGLVLTMMGQQQYILLSDMTKQGLTTRPPRPLLEIAFASHIDVLGNKVHSSPLCLPPAMRQPLVSVGMQTMMHMHRQQALGQSGPAQGGE